MRRHGTTSAPAFTLVELLLVIAIVGVLAMVVVPQFLGFSKHRQLDESVNRMKALVAMCRAEAMNQSRRYRIELHRDGSVAVAEQRDPLTAPHEFVEVPEAWAVLPILMEDVWVASVLRLPEGPPPVLVDDRSIEFTKFEEQPVSITELDEPVYLEFAPNGVSPSARWTLRNAGGHGRQLTLDGRIGRIEVLDLDPLRPDQIERPRPAEETGRR
jgi:prepilin-type N-terminal cleavage/methylation domain-containing protein